MNDREILIELMHKHNTKHPAFCDFCFNKTKDELYATIAGVADHLIANGVTVQKQGEWEFHNTAYRCSECKAGFMMPVPYCWSCGAKMENTDGK